MKLRPGRLLGVYVVGYSIGRFWIEGLRIDPANRGGGWRLNQWTALIAGTSALAYLVIDWLRHRAEPVPAVPAPVGAGSAGSEAEDGAAAPEDAG
jgi:prolipoprotein diacylglyceryltransferase